MFTTAELFNSKTVNTIRNLAMHVFNAFNYKLRDELYSVKTNEFFSIVLKF